MAKFKKTNFHIVEDNIDSNSCQLPLLKNLKVQCE